MAYFMIASARRIRPRRDGGHLFEQYFLLWTAFDHIYTTIARQKGRRTRIKENEDGSVVTAPSGHVNIPEVVIVSEREQLDLAFQEFSPDLKRALVLHKGTEFFVGRTPTWQGKPIEYDAFGQRVNGVINVNYTSESQYPVWSPIDFQDYEAHLENPDDEDRMDFLARQVVALLHTVRENLMSGGKKLDDANDITVVENALPLLELIVTSFTR